MSKESGLGWAVAVDDNGGSPQTISNDITNLTLATPRAEQDVTGLDKYAHERILLLADQTTNLNGVFDDAANMSHAVLKTVGLAAAVARTITHTISGQSLAGEYLITDYNITRAAGGALTFSSPCNLSSGTSPTWS